MVILAEIIAARFGRLYSTISVMGGAQSQQDEDESILTDDGRTPKIYESTKLEAGQWPIVYSNSYNIGFMGLQRLHPFDSGKWGKIFTYLRGKVLSGLH